MAEALGAAASVLQLADVTIRSSLCLYTFFASLQSAQHDFQQFLIVIRNVHDAVQMLRAAVRDQPLNAIQEEAMRRHLDRINGELASFNKTIDGKDPTKLTTRIKWVLKSTNTDRALQRLETDKTSLLVLIQALNLEKSGCILRSQHVAEASISTLQSNLEEQHSRERALHLQFNKQMNDFHSEMELSQAMYHSSLQDGFSSLSREIEISGENIGNTLRYALEQHFRPMLEEALTNSEMRNEARIEEFRSVMNSATTQIMERMNRNERPADSQCEHESKELRLRKRIQPNDHSRSRYLDVQFSGHEKGEDELQNGSMTLPHISSSRRPITVTKWFHWTRIAWIGTFSFEFTTHSEPSRRFYTFKIDFWPSSKLLQVNGISLKYSSRPDRQGYTALSPSIAFRPIISEEDPIWRIIFYNDLSGITTRFQERRYSPFDQNDHGRSLLLSAASIGSFEVVQFLIEQGADPTQTTACGRNTLYTLLSWVLQEAVINSPADCTCSTGYDRLDLPKVFATIQLLITQGCDLEECDLRIFDYIQSPDFGSIPLNWQRHQEQDKNQIFGNEDEYAELSSERLSNTSQRNSSIEEHDMIDTTPGSSPDTYSTERQLFDETRYLTKIRLLTEFLNRQGLNLAQPRSSHDLERSLAQPQRMNLQVLQACGLDGSFEDPSCDRMKPILFTALHALYRYGDAVNMDNVFRLVASGADIYHVEWATEDSMDHVEDELVTPTTYATACDMLPKWLKVVAKAGYDPDEVLLEDIRRRREFRRLHGAKSSSVEIAEELREIESQEVRRRTVGKVEKE